MYYLSCCFKGHGSEHARSSINSGGGGRRRYEPLDVSEVLLSWVVKYVELSLTTNDLIWKKGLVDYRNCNKIFKLIG